MNAIKNKFGLLKLFDWKLFVSLVLLALVPAIIQTVETFIISTNVSASDIDVIGQIEWFDLIDETIKAFLIVPLYSILNSILKKRGEEGFARSTFKILLIVLGVYSLFSIAVLIYSESLIAYMNPNENDISLMNSYLSLSTVAFMIGIIVSYVNVVFVVLDKSRNVYFFLGAKAVVTLISDFLIIPYLGVIGVAVSNIVINAALSAFGLFILFWKKSMKLCWYKKSDFRIAKDWLRIGGFSGIQQFVANLAYALMVVKMVNLVSEAGNYWVSNNFIWGWLLIPITALAEVIKKDCKEGYGELIQSNYYLIVIMVIVLWCLTIPLWPIFFRYAERIENYERIFQIVLIAFPFYVPYALEQIPDSIFIGLGKTKYNFANTCIVNTLYYGVWFILYKTNSITFDMTTIIMMFGFGMVTSYLISILEEKLLLKREIAKLDKKEEEADAA